MVLIVNLFNSKLWKEFKIIKTTLKKKSQVEGWIVVDELWCAKENHVYFPLNFSSDIHSIIIKQH